MFTRELLVLLLRCVCLLLVFHFLRFLSCAQDPGGAACARGGPADHHGGGGAEETRQ